MVKIESFVSKEKKVTSIYEFVEFFSIFYRFK